MTWLTYTLTAHSRVSAGRSAEILNSRAIHRVLPGVTVRGAVAAAWLRHPETPFPATDRLNAFERLFEPGVAVTQAVPSHTRQSQAACLLPLSHVRCKYPDIGGDPACDDEWWDEARHGQRPRCTVCGSGTRSGRGWSVPAELDAAATRSALANGVPVKEKLFTRQSVRAGVRFTGRIHVADTDDRSRIVEWLCTERSLRVGGQRSTMGAARWQAQVAKEPAPVSGADGPHVLVLQSPAILLGNYGEPTTDLRRVLDDVRRRAGSPGTVGRVWSRPDQVSGWNGIAGLATPVEVAVSAGSVAVLEGGRCRTGGGERRSGSPARRGVRRGPLGAGLGVGSWVGERAARRVGGRTGG